MVKVTLAGWLFDSIRSSFLRCELGDRLPLLWGLLRFGLLVLFFFRVITLFSAQNLHSVTWPRNPDATVRRVSLSANDPLELDGEFSADGEPAETHGHI